MFSVKVFFFPPFGPSEVIGQLLAKATGFRGYEKVQLLGVYNTKKLAKEEWTQEPKSLAGILGVEHNLY